MRDDQHCAWFLVDHILSTPRTPELERHAELKVWEQIDRAKRFARALGMWFHTADRVSEIELEDLAASHGLGYQRMSSPHYRLHLGASTHVAYDCCSPAASPRISPVNRPSRRDTATPMDATAAVLV